MKVTRTWIENNFNKFNTKYFEGKLPTPLFKICNTYRMLGQCGAKNWRTAHPLFTIKISNYFDRTEKEFQNTLIHEMIHLYFQSKGMWKVGHGHDFQQMAREFDKYGWNIHTKETNWSRKTTSGTIDMRIVLTFTDIKTNKIWICCIANDTAKIKNFLNTINNCRLYTNPHLYTTNSDKFSGLKISHKRLGGKVVDETEFVNDWLPKMMVYSI